MDLSISALWTNSYHFLKAKVVDGLTPLQKTVAVVALAYIALAACAYLIYRCCWHKAIQIDSSKLTQPKENVTEKPLNEEESLKSEEVGTGDTDLSSEKIIIYNADRIRELINKYQFETIDQAGQWRDLYLDREGRINSIDGPDGQQVWLDETKEEDLFFRIRITVKMYFWDPSKGPAFNWDADRYREHLSAPVHHIVASTIDELNLLARGAYHTFNQKNPVSQVGLGWVSIFENVNDYSSAALLSGADSTPFDAPPKVDDKGKKDIADVDESEEDLEKKISDVGVEHLKNTKLMPVDFSACTHLTDDALKYLKGMPLTKLDLSPALPLYPADGVAAVDMILPWENLPIDIAVTPLQGKKKTAQQSLADNCRDAQEQQAKQTPKGFKLFNGSMPRFVEATIGIPVCIAKHEVRLEGIADCGTASCIGRRNEMEDAELAEHTELKHRTGTYPMDVFGIFDGHAGDKASAYVKQNLMAYLIKELESNDQGGLSEEGIIDSLKKCFQKLDADYTGIDGTTAAVAFTLNGKLWVANVGDSRILLVKKDGTVIQATEDAKPSEERYKRGIEKRGGFVSMGRVNGQLAVARAIGDKHLIGTDDVRLVSPNPKVTCYPFDEIDLVVLACDGLYEVASTDEIGEAAKFMHIRGETAMEMAERLVYCAIEQKSGDNVSVVVVKT